jgi:hypothetical protein
VGRGEGVLVKEREWKNNTSSGERESGERGVGSLNPNKPYIPACSYTGIKVTESGSEL